MSRIQHLHEGQTRMDYYWGAEVVGYFTAGLPGTGGKIKSRCEDFVVEEIPLYEPCGTGLHTIFEIEKRNISTPEAIARIAGALRVAPSAVSCAGFKDARGVTRQYFSVTGVSARKLLNLKVQGIDILNATPHRNKLQVGHLRGNRFEILIRKVVRDAYHRAQAILNVLQERGVPNFFGPQRFGFKRDAHEIGKAMVHGDVRKAVHLFLGTPTARENPRVRKARKLYEERQYTKAFRLMPTQMRHEKNALLMLKRTRGDVHAALRSIPANARRLFIAAYQSALFNRTLSRRLPEIDELWEGDLATLGNADLVFRVQSPENEKDRLKKLDIHPSGPLFGRKMLLPDGRQGEIEKHILEEEAIGLDSFEDVCGLRVRGSRRPLRFAISAVELQMEEESLRLRFEAPRGCYATSVLREIMKDGVPSDAASGTDNSKPTGEETQS